MTLFPTLFCDSESPDIAADSHSSYADMVSSDTICEIDRLVNYAIRRIVKSWSLSEADCEDLYQDAVVAAIEAYRRFDPAHGRKLQNWLLERIVGQLKDSVRKLRSGGVVGGEPIVVALDDAPRFAEPVPSDGQPGRQLSNSGTAQGPSGDYEGASPEPIDNCPGPAEKAELAGAMDLLGERLGTLDKLTLSLYYGLNGQTPAANMQELGDRLGCSKAAAWQRLRRARIRALKVLS